jgi:hypothetical protein
MLKRFGWLAVFQPINNDSLMSLPLTATTLNLLACLPAKEPETVYQKTATMAVFL